MSETTYTYDEAYQKSLEYFEGDELAAKVFVDKYALRNDKDEFLESNPEMTLRRISREVARIEAKKFKNPMTEDEIFSYLDHFKRLIPQGSPLYGIGNKYQYVTISNCYVIESPFDSYCGIMLTDEEIVNTSKRRGGVGVDLSTLRPNGSRTTNAARSSTGVVPFAERYSNSIREVGQNNRRGACLMSLSIHHPDVMQFIRAKANLNKITGANISVMITDEFMGALKNKTTYEMRWPVDSDNPSISMQVDAKEVWDEIMSNAWKQAEPGVIFIDTIRDESPADCYSEQGFRTLSCNPCAELPLAANSSCILLAMNAYGYVKNPFTVDAYFDFESFYHDAQIAERILDDFVDLEIECVDRIIDKVDRDPEPNDVKQREKNLWLKMKEKCIKGRRTGLGITALGDVIASCGHTYGSEDSVELAKQIYMTLRDGAYKSSVDMAKELGPFPVWDYALEKDNVFLNRFKETERGKQIYEEMKKHGRRNIGLLTSAPSGSISLLSQTTSGIEPLFAMSHTRRKKINEGDNQSPDFVDVNGDKYKVFKVFHPKLLEWQKISGDKDINNSPYVNSCSHEISWINRVKLQSAANKYICHSISSTVNLPSTATLSDVKQIYETAYDYRCKGITIYRDGSRSGIMGTGKDKPQGIIKTNAPKRPQSLLADIYHTTVKGETYFVIVGMYKDDPYEIFAGKNGDIQKSLKKARIVKQKRGVYALCKLDSEEILHPDVSKYINDEEETITRLISSNLRHGCDVSFVVHQLEKTEGDMISFTKAVARILKKYIPDDTEITGEDCIKCGGVMIRYDGCGICRECGYSKCP